MKKVFAILLGILLGIGYLLISFGSIFLLIGLFSDLVGAAEVIVLILLIILGIAFIFISRKIKLK